MNVPPSVPIDYFNDTHKVSLRDITLPHFFALVVCILADYFGYLTSSPQYQFVHDKPILRNLLTKERLK